MKRILTLSILFLLALTLQAQDAKFSPEKFEADMEAYITSEAALTPQEATKFFPLFREMHQKQRDIYKRMHAKGKQRPDDEAACAEAIKQCDKWNIELKKIEQEYHQRFLRQLPAVKVYKIIQAENRFHRQMMKGWQRKAKDKPRDRRR